MSYTPLPILNPSNSWRRKKTRMDHNSLKIVENPDAERAREYQIRESPRRLSSEQVKGASRSFPLSPPHPKRPKPSNFTSRSLAFS